MTGREDPKSPERMKEAAATCTHVGGHIDPYAADLYKRIKEMREQFDDSTILRAAGVVLVETKMSWFPTRK